MHIHTAVYVGCGNGYLLYVHITGGGYLRKREKDTSPHERLRDGDTILKIT
jgi:hypothetical protein